MTGCSSVLVNKMPMAGGKSVVAHGIGTPSHISQELATTNSCPATIHFKTVNACEASRIRYQAANSHTKRRCLNIATLDSCHEASVQKKDSPIQAMAATTAHIVHGHRWCDAAPLLKTLSTTRQMTAIRTRSLDRETRAAPKLTQNAREQTAHNPKRSQELDFRKGVSVRM